MKKDIAESRSVCYSYVKVIGNVTDNDTENGAEMSCDDTNDNS